MTWVQKRAACCQLCLKCGFYLSRRQSVFGQCDVDIITVCIFCCIKGHSFICFQNAAIILVSSFGKMMYSNEYIQMTGETIIKKNKQKCCKVKYFRKIKCLVSTKHFRNDPVSYDSIQDSLENSLSLLGASAWCVSVRLSPRWCCLEAARAGLEQELCSPTKMCTLVDGKEKSRQHSTGSPKVSTGGGNIILNRTPLTTCEAVLSQLKQVNKFLNEDYSHESILICIYPKKATWYKHRLKLCQVLFTVQFYKTLEWLRASFSTGFLCLLSRVYIATLYILKFSHGDSKLRHYWKQLQPKANNTS